MTYFPDMGVCDYFGLDHSGRLKAVGWLDSEFEYLTGEIDEGIFKHIEQLMQDPFQPVISAGLHQCNLCQFNGPKGARNIFIPSNGDIIVCPELILHYIDCHAYLPPDIFINAIMQIKDTRGMVYKKQLLENNGSFLLQQ